MKSLLLALFLLLPLGAIGAPVAADAPAVT